MPLRPSLSCWGQRRSLYCHQKGRLEGLGRGTWGKDACREKWGGGKRACLGSWVVLEAEKQLVSKAAGLVCTGRIVPAICVCKYQKGAGGVSGVSALCSSCPPPPPSGFRGSWLSKQGHYNPKPIWVRICGVSGQVDYSRSCPGKAVALASRSQPARRGWGGLPLEGWILPENKMERRSSLRSEEGYLVAKGFPILGESPEWLFCISPGAPTSTFRRESGRCIEGAFGAPFIMSTKVMSFKSCLKSAFACFPVPLVVLIESKYH